MDSTAKPSTIEWAIKEIKELEFYVDEFKDIGPSFDFNYTVDLQPIAKEDVVRWIITATYMRTDTKEVLLKGRIMTVFLIKNLKSMSRIGEKGAEEVDLPEPLWIALFSIAFTHARAILAKSSAGTKFSNLLLPPINPATEFQKLFGHFLKKGKYT